MNKIDSLANKLTRYLFIILCGFILIAKSCNFIDYFTSSAILIIISVGLLIISMLLIIKNKNKIKSILNKFYSRIDKLNYKKMTIILILLSIITKSLFLALFQIDPTKHSDISMYWNFIKQINQNNFIIDNAEYALTWPHTVMMALFYSFPAKILGTTNIYLYSIFNILMLTLSSYLIFNTITYLKNKNIAFISSLLWIVIPVGIMQPSMLIHENTLIFVHCLTFFLYFKVIPSLSNKIYKSFLFFLILLILSFESLINQFALVAIIALLIDIFVKNIKFMIKFMSIITALLCVLTANNFETNYINNHVTKIEKDVSLTIPYGWTFYLGLNYETGGYYSDNDAVTWYKYADTNNKELIISYEKELIVNRIEEYIQCPLKIVKHINDKMKIIWSDYNPIGYRGSDGKCFGNELCQNFNDSKIDTIIYILINYFNSLIAFVMLYLCIKHRKQTDDDYIRYSKLFIIGVNIILLFIEVMPKYSSHMPMIFLWILSSAIFKDNI